MKLRSMCWGVTYFSLLATTTAWAEIQVTWEHVAGRDTSPQFSFQQVPSPSAADAATNARFSIADGREDANSGGLDTLTDGRGPTRSDQPSANFFFGPGTKGGRLVADLGETTELKQVNTYSWHSDTRGPQVYQLYASDGAAVGFQVQPAANVAPELVGWKRLASVDTRPADGEPGGQYGVSLSDPDTGSLGKYRYLLFDISRTESADPFGNTFFSEIDISDGRQHVAKPFDPGDCEITFDVSEVPELRDWVDSRLRPVCREWYPRIVAMLPSDGYQPPRSFSVTFRKDMQGVAYTSGTRIVCAGGWFQRNLEGEATGAVVHEIVHVVQQYGRVRGSRANPSWLVEGVADYIRWFHFEPPALRPRPNLARAKYTDSYRTTAAFLDYVAVAHDKEIVQKFNTAMREGRYDPELWKTFTGKTVDELWAAYTK